jgi:hypothetical protein
VGNETYCKIREWAKENLTAEEINRKMLSAENSIGRAVLTWQYGEGTEQQQISYMSWLKVKCTENFFSFFNMLTKDTDTST